MSYDQTTFNNNIRAEMARHGESQTSIAARLHISQGGVSRRLTGHQEWTIGELATVAEALGVPLSALIPDGAAA